MSVAREKEYPSPAGANHYVQKIFGFTLRTYTTATHSNYVITACSACVSCGKGVTSQRPWRVDSPRKGEMDGAP